MALKPQDVRVKNQKVTFHILPLKLQISMTVFPRGFNPVSNLIKELYEFLLPHYSHVSNVALAVH